MGGVLLLLAFEIWFDWIPPYPESEIGTKGGYSVLSFAILYLLARAIKLYGLPKWFSKYSLIIYFVCSLTLAFSGQFVNKFVDKDVSFLVFSYINPIVIISSLAFFMSFERLHVHSKFINHIAQSTLAILLGHTAIYFLYTKQFNYLYNHFSGIQVVVYWALAIAIVFFVTLAIDQIRLLLYKPIKKWIKGNIQNDDIFDINQSRFNV